MFGCGGSCATLEDWFDRRRTQDDYVPTRFKPDGTKAFAVKGHLFRLNPSIEDQESAHCVSEELIEPEYPSRKQR